MELAVWGPKWRPFTRLPGRGPRVPPPPWARKPPKPSEAERERPKRADARAERLHLVGLTNAAVIMGVALGAVVVMIVLILVSHH